MRAQAEVKISKRRDRGTAHCDYRKHLKSPGNRQEGGPGSWNRMPQTGYRGRGHLDSATSMGQTSGPRQSEPQRGQAGK